MTAITQRRVSIERMARIWRWSVDQDSGEGLTMDDLIGLEWNVDSFGEFIDVNRANVQLYEEAAV